MKVIGTADGAYICTVSHTELEKFLDLYYGKLERLRVGQEIDLGKGYDYASQIGDAMRKTRELVQSNQVVVTAILNGLRFEQILASRPAQPESGPIAKAVQP